MMTINDAVETWTGKTIRTLPVTDCPADLDGLATAFDWGMHGLWRIEGDPAIYARRDLVFGGESREPIDVRQHEGLLWVCLDSNGLSVVHNRKLNKRVQ